MYRQPFAAASGVPGGGYIANPMSSWEMELPFDDAIEVKVDKWADDKLFISSSGEVALTGDHTSGFRPSTGLVDAGWSDDETVLVLLDSGVLLRLNTDGETESVATLDINNSPWALGAPHKGLAEDNLSTRVFTSGSNLRLPGLPPPDLWRQ